MKARQEPSRVREGLKIIYCEFKATGLYFQAGRLGNPSAQPIVRVRQDHRICRGQGVTMPIRGTAVVVQSIERLGRGLRHCAGTGELGF
jgi:hypothetical protein